MTTTNIRRRSGKTGVYYHLENRRDYVRKHLFATLLLVQGTPYTHQYTHTHTPICTHLHTPTHTHAHVYIYTVVREKQHHQRPSKLNFGVLPERNFSSVMTRRRWGKGNFEVASRDLDNIEWQLFVAFFFLLIFALLSPTALIARRTYVIERRYFAFPFPFCFTCIVQSLPALTRITHFSVFFQ